MAIKYFPNPLDEKEVIETSAKTIKEALVKLEIENDPLCVVINGKCPDDIDLDYGLKDSDEVEVRRIVEGNAEGWANVVDVLTVVAVVALTATGFGAVAIGLVALGGALASGAIRKGIKPPDIKNSIEQESIIGNDISLNRATNRIRRGENIPIVLGEIRVVPDTYSFPFTRNLYGISNNFGTVISDIAFFNQVPPGRNIATQSFALGFGDIQIDDDVRIGTKKINKNGYDAGYELTNYSYRKSETDLESSFIEPQTFYYPLEDEEGFAIAQYYMDVNLKERVALAHKGPNSGVLPEENEDDPDWVYFQGQPGQNEFYFEVSGTFPNNEHIEIIQVHVKMSNENSWRNFPFEDDLGNPVSVLTMALSHNPDIGERVYYTMGKISHNQDNKNFPMVRVRKALSDNVKFSANIQINNFHFLDEGLNLDSLSPEDREKTFSRIPINVIGLYLTNFIDSDSSENNFSLVVSSKCWVLRDSQWLWEKSSNPAWIFLYFARGGYLNYSHLTSEEGDLPEYPFSPTRGWQNYPGHEGNRELMFGGGYTNEKIDIEKIIEWASFCDENNLTIGISLRDEESVSESLEKIANIGRASVFYNDGKLSVVYEDKDQVPVTMFGMANIKAGSFSVSYMVERGIDKVICSFLDKSDEYELKEIESLIPFSGEDKFRSTKVVLDGVVDPDQAQRECNLLAARQFFQTRSYSWETDHEGFTARRGDLVYLSHDSVQYGYSGRVHKFIIEGGIVKGFETTANISDVSWVMIRLPNSEMKKYRCEFKNGFINFIDEFLIQDAPFQIKDKRRDSENKLSRFNSSISEDYIFIADIKETVGKIVRIAGVESREDNFFAYTAVDEDPAMWAFEYGVNLNPESLDDSIGIIEVVNIAHQDLGGGRVKLDWNGSDDCLFMIIDKNINQPVSIDGRFSVGSKSVTLELESEREYTLEIVPLALDEKIQSITKQVTFWLQ